MTILLKTLLAKNGKDGGGGGPVSGGQPLVPLTDTSKLKKHISVVCERLARGGSLTSGSD